ncbi:MAG: glycoside hydrolase [Capsulimonas sp.]|nr:glycoside hydrolase [Capsulimonas sp.]
MTHTHILPAASHEFRLEGDPGAFQVNMSREQIACGLQAVTVTLTAALPAPPPNVKIVWSHPDVDIQASWTPAAGRDRGITYRLGKGFPSKATNHAPVVCLYSQSGANRLTFAASDALHGLRCAAALIEETAEFECSVTLFADPSPLIERYELTLWVDTRDISYFDALRGVSDWWARLPGYEPCHVPETARRPMYSTWYSFHQAISPEAVLEQCRLAKPLGCDAVIVDDGWQTLDGARGYAYCGDWRPERTPDMRAFVDAVHAEGMAFLLWYSVPFIGRHSDAYQKFQGKFLADSDHFGAAILDPRFPEAREYLIGIYERALREWGLDGFKLDFVDSMGDTEEAAGRIGGGRDYDSVSEAADRLLADVMARLRAINPDVMIEFRQSYIGPLMRKYGNLFRAGDCPNDAVTNRLRVLDIRLLSGDTPAHADMLMWSPEEPAEAAALQLLNVLFSVPQISVLLDRIPEDHRAMLRFWMGFWTVHRDALLHGRLEPLQPDLCYPIVRSFTDRELVAAIYSENALLPLDGVGERDVFVVNGTRNGRLALELLEDLGERRLQVFDCRGELLRDERITLCAGLHAFAVPPAGLWQCVRNFE